MAKGAEIRIPIVCENERCENYGNLVNLVRGIKANEADLFYDNFNGSVEEDYCPICGELGVAEDPILV